jgi:hypothetical protein
MRKSLRTFRTGKERKSEAIPYNPSAETMQLILGIGSEEQDCACSSSHTTGRAVFRIRRLNAAALGHGGCKVGWN